jgi:hypothetical protein
MLCLAVRAAHGARVLSVLSVLSVDRAVRAVRPGSGSEDRSVDTAGNVGYKPLHIPQT